MTRRLVPDDMLDACAHRFRKLGINGLCARTKAERDRRRAAGERCDVYLETATGAMTVEATEDA